MGKRLYLTCRNGLNCNVLIQALTKLVKQQNLSVKNKLKEETEQRLIQVYDLLEEAGKDREEDKKQQEELGKLLDALESVFLLLLKEIMKKLLRRNLFLFFIFYRGIIFL